MPNRGKGNVRDTAEPMGTCLKSAIGCWVHERWRAECALRPQLSRVTGIRWQDIRNRCERLGQGDHPLSRVCQWEGSSWLTVTRVFPRVGARLLRLCLAQRPLHSARACSSIVPAPEISVVLPVAGHERIPQFLCVLDGFLGQPASKCAEFIVVEHSVQPCYASACPPYVRYFEVARGSGEPFNKSKVMNFGARVARAPYLLYHDSDILAPRDYLSEILLPLRAGWEAVRPLRFLFCLDQACSSDLMSLRQRWCPRAVPDVMQNFPGGSTAVRRDTMEAIGGYDEGFSGWGGEDDDFLDRLETRRLLRGGWLPGIHLWHLPQPRKQERDNPTLVLLTQRRALPMAERIGRLRAADQGRLVGPAAME